MVNEPVPRLGSFHDTALDTSVSGVVADLARLSDLRSVPRPAPGHTPSARLALQLDPFELWMFNVVSLGMCVQAIVDISPLSEDDTLVLLARLVGKGIVTFEPARTIS